MDRSHSLAASRDLGQRVLRLIETLHHPDDIAPEKIEQATGIRVEFNPEDPNVYGFGRPLETDWICNLVSLPEPGDHGRPRRLVFSFDDQSGAQADMSGVCGLAFEDYARALADAGYAAHINYGPRDAFNSFGFSRGDVSIEVLVRGETAQNPDRLCVSSMIIDTAGVRHA